MKIAVIRSNLKDAIFVVEKLAGDKLSLPVLKNILIETTENKIQLTATNLEIALSSSTPGKIIESGKITVPAGVLANIVNNLKTERLNLEKKGNKLEIKTDAYEAAIQGIPADDFPITPKIKDQSKYIEISGKTLKSALGQVLTAAQFSDWRPELNSVFFNFLTDSIKLAATDSFRLAEKTIFEDQFNHNYKEHFQLLVPLRTAQETIRVFGDEDTLRIYHDENQVLFKSDKTELLSRLLDGRFPDYEAIVPKKFSGEIVVNREELQSALKLTGVFGSKSGEIRLRAKEGKKIVEVFSSDQTVGENKYLLQAKTSGETGEIVFNWRYVADALKTIESEEIFWGINGEDKPAEIKPVGDNSYFYVLKPISI